LHVRTYILQNHSPENPFIFIKLNKNKTPDFFGTGRAEVDDQLAYFAKNKSNGGCQGDVLNPALALSVYQSASPN
jgi:hypothetical protein